MGRLLIVSNRLPVTVSLDGGEVKVERSAGGLATGLSAPHENGEGLWIGWPGKTWTMGDAQRGELDRELTKLRLVPIHLAEDDVRRYYEGFSNGVLWPLFHYLLDKIPLHGIDYPAYQRVNARFADEIARVYRDGDVIWIHDYQLLLLPALVRERLPHARIGFFLHIPFPASAVLRTLPYREQILRGMLGADLIGFHTHSYVRHFAASLLRVLGLETSVDVVRHEGRSTRVGAFPMGIDARSFDTLARSDAVRERCAGFRGTDGCRLLVGIDRLDYTKGIPRRFLAFEELLKDHTDLHGRVRLVQVAVPSRSNVRAYREQREQIDALVGRINGAYGSPTWSPVHYMHRSLNEEEVVALYCATDVMLVTPVRDGMNLVAKEFAASRHDEDGVLVLSEFAGAAAELAGALQINPYDVAAASRVMRRALDMPERERRDRMRSMRTRVFRADVATWVDDFLGALGAREGSSDEPSRATSDPAQLEKVLAELRRAERLVLLVDYDGTLVPFQTLPEEAKPDDELLELLRDLSRNPRVDLHLVSGRPRADLDEWFGELPISLHAEHGLWSRRKGSSSWRRLPLPGLPHSARIEAILREFAERTPGARVEVKSSVLAWHWRAADPEFGARQANELRLHMAELLSNVGAEVVCGDRVIEVRPYGLHKGAIVPSMIADAREHALILAMGDDRTDEDMFASLPEGSIAIHVGPNPSQAPIRLESTADAREFLRGLTQDASASSRSRSPS